MRIEVNKLSSDRCCNECGSQKDVKELYIGVSAIALCKECREGLASLMESEVLSNG